MVSLETVLSLLFGVFGVSCRQFFLYQLVLMVATMQARANLCACFWLLSSVAPRGRKAVSGCYVNNNKKRRKETSVASEVLGLYPEKRNGESRGERALWHQCSSRFVRGLLSELLETTAKTN